MEGVEFFWVFIPFILVAIGYTEGLEERIYGWDFDKH